MNYFKNSIHYLFIFSFLIFVFGIFFQLDFGWYQSDYFRAHLPTMFWLHDPNLTIFQKINGIGHSASGLLPLWIMGFFETFVVHKAISICIFLITLVLILYKSFQINLKNYGFLLVSSLLISPTIISTVNWILPEIITLLIVVLFILFNEWILFSFFLSFFIPLGRQTFVIFPFIFYFFIFLNNKKIKLNDLFILSGGIAGIVFLYFFWSGLVPPSKQELHQSASFTSFTYGLILFSFYFIPLNIFYLAKKQLVLNSKLFYSIIFTIIILLLDRFLFPTNQIYGGFIFSKLRLYEPSIAFIIELIIISCFLYFNNFKIIGTVIFLAFVMAQTNFIFIRYTDFIFLSVLLLPLLNLKSLNNIDFQGIASSFYLIQLFSLVLHLKYYYL